MRDNQLKFIDEVTEFTQEDWERLMKFMGREISPLEEDQVRGFSYNVSMQFTGDIETGDCPRCGEKIPKIIWGMTDCPVCGLHFGCC